jgi:hypothetical protein
MSLTAKKLYELLPAYYRVRDSEEGEPLKALIEVIAREAGVVDTDITQLYENWFIETCAEWVVPYIGDLLGVRGVHSISDADVFSLRAYTANTLSYRRRKGTAPVLEQLALDVTGWRARVVEFFQLLGAVQNMNHIRLHSLITPDLRRMNELDLLDTAFDTISHTVDVRRISTGLGRHNIPNIGLFLWRLQSYPMNRSTARAAGGLAPLAGRYTFSPLGYDSQLFNRPQTERVITHLAEEINVPGLLRPRALHDELEARRQALVDGRTPIYNYFGPNDTTDTVYPSVLKIYLENGGVSTLVPAEEICICNLEDWHLPPAVKTYKRLESDGTYSDVPKNITAAVDPVLGRLTLSTTAGVDKVQVSYAYGFSGDVGGGPYDRQTSVSGTLTRDVDWQVGVSKEITAVAGETIFENLTDAVDEWNKNPAEKIGKVGVITIMDNDTYKEDLSIEIPEASQLLIMAADWPEKDVPGGSPGEKERKKGDLTPDDLRPHIRGNLEIKGKAGSAGLTGGELVLNGLLVEGKLTVLDGNLGGLEVSHCTLVPRHGGLDVTGLNDRLDIHLSRSICGPVTLTADVSKLLVDECIVDNGGGTAVSAPLTPVEIQKSTVFGRIEAREIEAGNCIFNALVEIQRRQKGCIRFSYVPVDSHTPRRFRCQPDLEIKTQVEIEKAEKNQNILTQAEWDAVTDRVLAWLFPSFTSARYGHHAYAQLSRTCPLAIKTGAEDGSEMGVFNFLKQPQREANLQTALDEYLRLGLEAGIIYVT